ncbi:MAG: TlpA disulfide reductase family protein [Gemmatimonadota bacterium]
MGHPSRKSHSRAKRAGARSRGRRPARTLGLIVAALAVAGVLAVRARSGSEGPRIHLYQGQATLGSTTVSLDSLLGKGRPVVVNFWASNCPPCREEMPAFQRVYAAHGDEGYLMIGVDVGPQTGLGTHQGAQALIRRLGIRYPVGYAEGNALVVRYGLRGMPTTLFFDASGHLSSRVVGYLDEARFRGKLAALLASAN